MHQAFTGSTRKSRQVNLGGRSAPNPWAALPGSTKSSHGAPATQSTIAQAQADRLRRQHEREKVTASKKVQQTWRGHATRRSQKELWRREWDAQEHRRVQVSHEIRYEDVLKPQFRAPAYASLDLLLSQLRLLVHFQEFRRGIVRHETDTLRVLYLVSALRSTSQSLEPFVLGDSLVLNLSKFGVIVAQLVLSSRKAASSPSVNGKIAQLSAALFYLTSLIPREMNLRGPFYMHVLRQVIESHAAQDAEQNAVAAILALMISDDSPTKMTYSSFAREVLSDEFLSRNSRVMSRFIVGVDQNALARAISAGLRLRLRQTFTPDATDHELWQLSYLIHFQQQAQLSGTNAPQLDYIEALSLLLGLCANEIAERLNVVDHSMDDSASDPVQPLPPFIREKIAFLGDQESIKRIVSELNHFNISSRAAHQDANFVARLLANYAVAMLRAFPTKATNIRMCLYQGSITLSSGKDVSIIQYFWSISSQSAVFRMNASSHKNVLRLLTEASVERGRGSHNSPADDEAQVTEWREEWRIILLFLELYSFVLKLMDDEDFFSLENSHRFGQSETITNQFRRSALPLKDIAYMTKFLKNLAFVLYWNAAELADSNEVEESGGIAALFGTPTPGVATSRASEKPKAQSLTGNGVSQAYLKDLSTGLLRMLHERDSRRKFLPDNHWLMTSQVDMVGFIPAVVAEEEKRHELAEDVDEDQDDELANDVGEDSDNHTTASASMLRSVFGIREPHTPRTMASRHAERLDRQRNQARKKRLLESLAPRLEILRNLPFFIPFETRVQIFREFVFRDQIRRRDGYVDADNWRMNVANTTQGRGVDGRPRGFDVISRQHAEIHRESVFEDAYASFYELGEGLKEPIQISFIDKFGSPEAGIDGGGVTKEFLMSVTSEAFDPKGSLSMFQENEQRFLYPNPLIFDETAEHLRQAGIKQGSEEFGWHVREFLRRFEFLGRVVGKCLYEGILIDVNFAGFFLLKWALTGGSTSASNESAYRATINDLREFDEELYQGLVQLKNYSGDVEADFSLNFTVTDTLHIANVHGGEDTRTVTRDLMGNGSNVSVTNLNRPAYIDRIVRYRLQEQPRLVTNAFLKGLSQIIQPMWLAMFNQKELQKVVGGDNTELDIADLRRNTQYGGLYVVGDDGLEHPTVELFWKALREMDDEDRRKVLKFVTSTPRAPLLGFSHLNPKFSIRDSSEDQDRLPSTSTCVNLLKLPRYGDLKTMTEKLLYAVNSGAGFDLS